MILTSSSNNNVNPNITNINNTVMQWFLILYPMVFLWILHDSAQKKCGGWVKIPDLIEFLPEKIGLGGILTVHRGILWSMCFKDSWKKRLKYWYS